MGRRAKGGSICWQRVEEDGAGGNPRQQLAAAEALAATQQDAAEQQPGVERQQETLLRQGAGSAVGAGGRTLKKRV